VRSPTSISTRARSESKTFLDSPFDVDSHKLAEFLSGVFRSRVVLCQKRRKEQIQFLDPSNAKV